MEKGTILALVIQVMRGELGLLNRAAEDARSGATDSEVKSESKYDTRGVESSYLARGHAMKFEALAADVALLENFEFPDFEKRDKVGVGALVSLKMGRELLWFFVLPKGGGIEVEMDDSGSEITVITPDAPMGGSLLGLSVGDTFSLSKNQPTATVKSIE
jgi:hypothetical protein